MYNDTVTLFNRLHAKTGDTWYPTVLTGVNLNRDKGAITARYGAESADTAILNVALPSTPTWYTPKAWAELTDHTEGITFAGGQFFDFFIDGEWEDAAPISDKDYTEGFYNYMAKTRDYVYAVTGVNGPFSVIPHLEVTGR